jgi:hypothetical protein
MISRSAISWGKMVFHGTKCSRVLLELRGAFLYGLQASLELLRGFRSTLEQIAPWGNPAPERNPVLKPTRIDAIFKSSW